MLVLVLYLRLGSSRKGWEIPKHNICKSEDHGELPKDSMRSKHTMDLAAWNFDCHQSFEQSLSVALVLCFEGSEGLERCLVLGPRNPIVVDLDQFFLLASESRQALVCYELVGSVIENLVVHELLARSCLLYQPRISPNTITCRSTSLYRTDSC